MENTSNDRRVASTEAEKPNITKQSNKSRENSELYSRKHLKRLQAEISSKMKCESCPRKIFKSIVDYQQHLTSVKHRKRTFKVSDCWCCSTCDAQLPNEKEWLKHITSKRHLNRLATDALLEFRCRPLTTYQEIQSFVSSSCLETEDYEIG
ncbi:hypothetical protein TrispH2_004908 [Trichoplax sp. H2]|nr:hypothetical protein TrispH2_004908 [Trichoplax sp. H2]|eukprot:RDD42950.1 hypothetical protein TrispH2_004908 [Trichoplax sp. H2]